MPALFAGSCPHCHQRIRVEEQAEGAVRCPGCGFDLTPAAKTLSHPPAPSLSPAPETTSATPEPAETLSLETPLLARAEFRKAPWPHADPPSGKGSAHLGRFEVRQRLGEGAFGIVYRAYDPQLDRDVALKVAKGEVLNSPRRVERFLREAKAAAQLRHPHIVPLFEAGRDGSQYYIASAFIPGQTLAETLEAARPAFAQAAHIVQRLAEALCYAHSLGIIHRDVKPANVMLDLRGEPLILDFGLATRSDGSEKLTQEGSALGTPAYVAPEQAEGNAVPASDQYSLGCTLYELLTGKTPFGGPSPIQLLLHREKEPPPRSLHSGIPRDLETICLKCLEKDPSKRYPDCQALADDLRRWQEGDPSEARRLGLGERFPKLARRRPAMLAAYGLTALLLGMLAITGTMTWLKQEGDLQRTGRSRPPRMA